MLEKEELINIHKGRARVYSFLGELILSPPEDELLHKIEHNIPHLKEIAKSNKEMMKSIVDINSCIELLKTFVEERELYEYHLDLLRKYTSLFCLMDSIPLYESYYTSENKLAMQKSRDEMHKLLVLYKLKFADTGNEFEDHLGVQLMFMGKLAEYSIEAINKKNKTEYENLIKEQSNFINNHFSYLDKLFQAVRMNPVEEILYKNIIKYICYFIKEDGSFLKELPGIEIKPAI